VQAMIALARGDRPLAARRLREAADVWRRPLSATGAADLLANLVDLGRPTVGTIEPARELARVQDDLAALDPLRT
jgi:hypothetical protein